jgi:inhibitor of cysteine peptidase
MALMRLRAAPLALTGWLGLLLLGLTTGMANQAEPPDGPGQPQSRAPETKTATDGDNHSAVTMNTGDALVLRIEAIPGTGYGWQIVKDASPHLVAVGSPVFEPKGRAEAGGTADEVFHFRAEQPGSGDLVLHYRRPWEKQAAPGKTYQLRVTVQ